MCQCMQGESYNNGEGGKERMTVMIDTGNYIAAKAAVMAKTINSSINFLIMFSFPVFIFIKIAELF